MAKHALEPHHEVQDAPTWHILNEIFGGWELPLSKIDLGFYQLQITKFMILELIAAALILLIFIPLARRIQTGGLPRGRLWNLFEGMLLFVRDQIARPNLDVHHDHSHHAHLEGAAPADEFAHPQACLGQCEVNRKRPVRCSLQESEFRGVVENEDRLGILDLETVQRQL